MSVTSDVVRGLSPVIALGALAGILYFYRDRIIAWFDKSLVSDAVNRVTDGDKPISVDVVDAESRTADYTYRSRDDTILERLLNTGETVTYRATEGYPPRDVSGVNFAEPAGGLDVSDWGLPEGLGDVAVVLAPPDSVGSPDPLSELLEPGRVILPVNEGVLNRPKNELIGQIHDTSEFTGGVDVYDIIKSGSSTGNSQIVAVRHGTNLSEGGVEQNSWDRVFKKGTYEVVWF